MATLRRIICCSMVILNIAISGLIIIILACAFTGGFSSVLSFDKSPVARLGENQLLSCFLNTDQTRPLSQISMTWTKSGVSGVVYEFKDRATQIEDQNSQFKGRATVIPAELLMGNASLLLSSVRIEDQGQYTCTVSSSSRRGTVSVYLRTGAFSAPVFTLSGDTLTAVAEQWFPEPSVAWTDLRGTVLNGNTSLRSNPAGFYTVETLLSPINTTETYVLKIENDVKFAVSQVTVAGSEITHKTDFYNTNQAASAMHMSTQLGFVIVFFFNGLPTIL